MQARSKRSRLPRRRGWLLVGLAAALAIDGTLEAPAAPAGVGSEEERPTAASGTSGGPAIGAALRRVNPTLSTAEIARIGDAVIRYSAKYGLDAELVTAVMVVESSGRPWAVSPLGARGLMQVMPHMVRPMGMVGNLSTIETNVEAGCVILGDNIRRLGEADGISAYFWGSTIRGDGYLERVRAARAGLRALATVATAS